MTSDGGLVVDRSQGWADQWHRTGRIGGAQKEPVRAGIL